MKTLVQTGISYFTRAFVLIDAACILFGQGLRPLTDLVWSLLANMMIGIVGAVMCQKGGQE